MSQIGLFCRIGFRTFYTMMEELMRLFIAKFKNAFDHTLDDTQISKPWKPKIVAVYLKKPMDKAFLSLSIVFALVGLPNKQTKATFPVSISIDHSVPESVSLSWPTVRGRSYTIRTTNNLSNWSQWETPQLPSLSLSTNMGLSIPVDKPSQFFQIVENASPYDPDWESVQPLRTLQFNYNSAKTDTENGAELKNVLQGLEPGDQLVIGAGIYSINSYTTLDIQGTASAPIRIMAAMDSAVVITRPNAGQNIINVGVNTQTRYVAFRDLEFRGGSHGIRLYDCREVWIDQCRIHDTGDVALSANARDTSKLYITRNEIWNTNGTGEGMYLGGNNGDADSAQHLCEFWNGRTVEWMGLWIQYGICQQRLLQPRRPGVAHRQ